MFVDDAVNFLIAVLFELGVVHRRRAVAKRLLGRQNSSAGQPGVVFDDVADCFAGHKEKINVAAVRLIVTVAVPVAADLLSHVEDAVIGIIVEKADRAQRVLVQTDVERDVLVHRIAEFRIVTDRVLGRHPQAPALFVEITCFLAEAVKMIPCAVHQRVMGNAAELIFLESSFPQVGIQLFTGFLIIQDEG